MPANTQSSGQTFKTSARSQPERDSERDRSRVLVIVKCRRSIRRSLHREVSVLRTAMTAEVKRHDGTARASGRCRRTAPKVFLILAHQRST
jgi:hypothetical protein